MTDATDYLRYYILKSWGLDMYGEDTIRYVCKMSGRPVEEVVAAVEELSKEMGD